METIQPLGNMVLVRKDEDKKTTQGGIILPDGCEKVVLTARVLGIGPAIDEEMVGFKQYDKIIVNPCRSIKVDFENDHVFLVPVDDVVAVIRKEAPKACVKTD